MCSNGILQRTVETSEMCLAAEPVIKHVKQILTPGLNRCELMWSKPVLL